MRFRDQPIARKALTLGVVPALCALVIVTVAFAVAVFVTGRDSLTRDNEALVAIIADNISAAVGFGDDKIANELLRGFRAERDVDKVCVYDAAGRLFASYVAPPHACEPTDFDAGARQEPLRFEHSVTVGERRVGSVLLTANGRSLSEQMRTLAMVASAALLVSAILAWGLAVRMQRSLAAPIMSLAATADRVAETRQFGLRAERTTDDEVGRLVGAFNGMLDQIERQDRVKDEFLATLSHELRTPLNATLGWLQILQKTEPDASKVERALTSIERNARAQQRVVEDLLDISRIVTGQLQMTEEVVDVRTVLTAAVDVVAEFAQRKSVLLRTDLPSMPCLVSGDPGRLQQVLWNLLSNSIKFTPSGGSVTVGLAHRDGRYQVTVRDTGIGISPDFLPRVFDRFQQADGSTTREYTGLGLGLAIVKEIAALHRGTVTAASDGLGHGATFVVSLPSLVDDSTPGRNS